MELPTINNLGSLFLSSARERRSYPHDSKGGNVFITRRLEKKWRKDKRDEDTTLVASNRIDTNVRGLCGMHDSLIETKQSRGGHSERREDDAANGL